MISRYFYLDILKSLAVFAVVLIHQSSTTVRDMSIDSYTWMANNVYFSISHFGVPLFVMISGALLLNSTKDYDILIWYKKAILRILVPLFIWSSIYYLYRTPIDFWSLNTFLFKFMLDKISGHFWFLYMIFGVYLSLPFLKLTLRNIDNRTLNILLFIWFIVSILNPIINYFFKIKINIHEYFITLYIGYFMLGYVLHKIKIEYKTYLLAIIIFFIGSISTVFGTYFLKISSSKLVGILWLNNSFPIFLIVLSIFIIIKYHFSYIVNIEKWWQKFIVSISINSYGIYLIHILVRNYSNSNFKIDVFFNNPYLNILIMSLIIIFISYFLIFFIRKIPYVGRYFG